MHPPSPAPVAPSPGPNWTPSTNRLARAYAELGLRQGDYVTIVLSNSAEWVQAVLATWTLGAVPQPLSARLPEAELHALLAQRQPGAGAHRCAAGRRTR